MRRQYFFFTFIFCFVVAFLLFIFFRNTSFSLSQQIISPVQRALVSMRVAPNSEIEKLKNQNLELYTKLAKMHEIEVENQALHDQFYSQSNQPLADSSKLLPARVVALPSFIPGVNTPSSIVIDKGSIDGLYVGGAIVVKDNIIGIVRKLNKHYASADLITNKSTVFTARASGTGANGILKGQGDQMIFDNVLLSDNLKRDDLIVTTGEAQLNGFGVPSGLVVGKIESIERSPSNLFQSASVKPLVDLSKLLVVFADLQNK